MACHQKHWTDERNNISGYSGPPRIIGCVLGDGGMTKVDDVVENVPHFPITMSINVSISTVFVIIGGLLTSGVLWKDWTFGLPICLVNCRWLKVIVALMMLMKLQPASSRRRTIIAGTSGMPKKSDFWDTWQREMMLTCGEWCELPRNGTRYCSRFLAFDFKVALNVEWCQQPEQKKKQHHWLPRPSECHWMCLKVMVEWSR